MNRSSIKECIKHPLGNTHGKTRVFALLWLICLLGQVGYGLLTTMINMIFVSVYDDPFLMVECIAGCAIDLFLFAVSWLVFHFVFIRSEKICAPWYQVTMVFLVVYTFLRFDGNVSNFFNFGSYVSSPAYLRSLLVIGTALLPLLLFLQSVELEESRTLCKFKKIFSIAYLALSGVAALCSFYGFLDAFISDLANGDSAWSIINNILGTFGSFFLCAHVFAALIIFFSVREQGRPAPISVVEEAPAESLPEDEAPAESLEE